MSAPTEPGSRPAASAEAPARALAPAPAAPPGMAPVRPDAGALDDEARAALATVRDLLRWGVTRLRAAQAAFGQGTDDPFDEAAWLLLWTLQLPPERLDPFLDARVLPAERDAFVALLARRCTERLPTAYLTGEAWLHGVRFRADARALVPRSPIADLLAGSAAESLDAWLPPDEAVADVLDLCTGGGSLAVLAAMRFAHARVVGSDVSADALALAAENVALHGLAERIELVRSDLFARLAHRRFDLIVCNPPYVNARSMRALPPEFRAEPPAALAGGADGMDLVRRILAGAHGVLREDGLLVIEIGHEAGHFEAAFGALEYAWLPVPAGERMVALVTREQLARA